jgi:hypothetical protein
MTDTQARLDAEIARADRRGEEITAETLRLVAAELERVTAVPCRCDKCRDCLAADELERVTAALREIMHLECSAMGDAESDLQRCKEIARAALADLSASPETTP